MTEKVKLTQEQADGIEQLKKNNFSDESIIAAHVREPNGWLLDENVALNRMPLLKLVDALRIGYEVELQYKIGDWVVYPSFGAGKVIVKVIDIQVHSRVQFETLSGWKAIRDIERHATPEEIKNEKERQMWAEIGREVGEFHVGDVTLDQNYYPIRVVNVEMAKTFYQQTKRIGFYPAESFISFESEEPV